jgi:putative ABC transport system substrate-binding protein
MLLALSALLPFAANAQAVPRIGFLTPRPQPAAPARDAFADAFLKGLGDLGYIEGRTIAIDWRYADGDYKRMGDAAAELVALNPRLVVAYGTAAIRILQGATKTVPIVVAAASDLAGTGLVASLARPGGNITGMSAIDTDVSVKRLEMLKQLVPGLSKVALLINPGNAAAPAVLRQLQESGPKVGVEVFSVSASTTPGIDIAFNRAAARGAGAVIVGADAFFSGQGKQIAAESLQHRLPTSGIYHEHTADGCLMNYGPDIADFHRQSARFVDRILKGANPAELPVEQPSKLDLTLNARTAKALGLVLPQTLLAQADQVIE